MRKEVATIRDLLTGYIQENPAPASRVKLLTKTLPFQAQTVEQLSELSAGLERQTDATEDFVAAIKRINGGPQHVLSVAMAAVASNSVWEKVTWNGTKTRRPSKTCTLSGPSLEQV